jgi:hypothetical protein
MCSELRCNGLITKNLPEVETKEGDNYKYPRLDVLMENCIKILEGKEVVDEGVKGGPGGKGGAPGKPGQPAAAKKPVAPPAPAKKDAGKGGKTGPGGKPIEEEVKEKTPLEKEMEQSLELEKQGTAYRVMQIYSFGQRVLQEMRQKAQAMYEKLNVWTEFSFKVECDLMDELATLLGSYIEGEKKIQEQLYLTNYDLHLNKQVLNFHTPPPIIRPAIEIAQNDRFLIVDLIRLQRELESLSDINGLIESRDLIAYFSNLVKYRPGLRTLPATWRNLSFTDFENLAARFDRKHTGKVLLKSIFTPICLQNSPFPDKQMLEEYRKSLTSQTKDGQIIQEAFIEAPAFFDATQEQKKLHERSNKFDRVKELKKILFAINGSSKKVDPCLTQNSLDVEQFINALSCRSLNLEEKKPSTYSAVLFPQAKTN